ncbi:MAG: NADPH-dependent glutamate synthase [Bacteroidales bacterium]|nr:NADPH-dependent glutamate synthase [Bacteroidales bacterium]
MYKIVGKRQLTPVLYEMVIDAPWVARSGQPGQFVIVIPQEKGERIPLTISDIDDSRCMVSIVFQVVGDTTRQLAAKNVGDSIFTIVGPLGKPSEMIKKHTDGEPLKLLFIGGGVGIAPIYPQVKWAKNVGIEADVIIGARTKDLLFYEDELRPLCRHLYVMTDDGSYGEQGVVTKKIDEICSLGENYTHCIAIGPLPMMKFVALTTKKYSVPTIASLNCMMVDGTGMCGACRVTVGDNVKFTCVDGPEFDAHLVDFDEAARRLKSPDERRYRIATVSDGHKCRLTDVAEETLKTVSTNERQRPAEQPATERARNFDEVNRGLTDEQARVEATRCLQCKTPQCVQHCPVAIKIPQFINAVKDGNTEKAYSIISEDSSLPAICGRVCPQENQCEGHCIKGIKGQPIAIGALERYVADKHRDTVKDMPSVTPQGKKVAVIGSGPSGLACASDLTKHGYRVTIFEALHHAGGVLVYGIPEFRLPKQKVVESEIENLRHLGVDIQTNVIVGKSVTIDQLVDDMHFEAVYVATGAGLPRFMGVKGETLTGVISANELLTRANLMHGYDEHYDTPILLGQKVIVVGGGNVAMDAARTAVRLGSRVTVVYRRGMSDMPARKEEVHHALEEGVEFLFQTAPIEVVGNSDGTVKALRCIKMQMGEPDAKGRRSFTPIEGSEVELEVDTIVAALGTTPNPLIRTTTPGLECESWGGIKTDENGKTSRARVFAGGDAVSGAATVILAMGAGRKAAKAIIKALGE